MSENQAENPPKPSKNALDLSTLDGSDFGPSWADGNTRGNSTKKGSFGQKPRSKTSRGGGKSDRRSHSGNRYSGNSQGDKANSDRRKTFNREGRSNWSQSQRQDFQPTVKVNIYPQDEAFDALVKRLRSTVRTYQLFEIANLILEKPERYEVVIQNKTKNDEDPELLYYTVPDHWPFKTEDSAVTHFLNNHLELLFNIEMVEIEPPKGNFQMVNRCTITGELLGPPNYHRYQEFLQRHYASSISSMSFDHFVSKVESVKDQESIDSWVESMKKAARYTLKEAGEGEPESFESLESVRSFLLNNRKDEVVGSGKSVRFAGRHVERLPKDALRRSVEIYIEQQLQFPLDTANNIRGRLRRHHFTVYKKGSKGISYVCAVKRKFRDSKTVFTPSIQEVIDFIEKNPNVLAAKLPELYMGINMEKQKPEKLEIHNSENADEQVDTVDEAFDTVEPADGAQSSKTDEPLPQVSLDSATSQAMPQSELNETDLKRLNQLMLNLRWLITEGYVTEYGDGRLFAPPPMPEKKPKNSESDDIVEAEKVSGTETMVE